MPNQFDFIFVSNTYTFLSYYKRSISKYLIECGFSVAWCFPLCDKPLITSSDPPPIYLCASRGGIASFSSLFFSFVRSLYFCRNTKIVSHTVIPNIALILAALLVNSSKPSSYVFVSGFGPSRIRNSLRIRLLGRIYLSILRYASRHRSIRVVCLNHFDANIIQDFVFARHVQIASEHNLSISEFNKSSLQFETRISSVSSRTLRVGFLGRFLLEKGLRDFYTVSSTCSMLGIQAEFSICGSTDIENSSSVDPLLLQLSSSDQVAIYKDCHFSEYFSRIDVFLFPSYREGHPGFLFKAMSFGVVPIVYPVPGCENDVIDGVNGLVSNSCSPSAMVSCINKLTSDLDMFKRLSTSSRTYSSSFIGIKPLEDLKFLLIN